MAGILDSFLTPENVQSGMNLLQGNQGIVNALTGLPIGPASGRAYIRNLSGSQEPITEDFFSTNQLDEIKRRTAEAMAKKSIYPDLRSSIPYNLESPLSMQGIFKDPKVDIDMTLGQAGYRKNPDGTISVIDRHNFDSLSGGGDYLYGQGEQADLGEGVAIDSSDLGEPRYLGERGLPFLPPVDIFGRTQAQATAEEVIRDPFTGEVVKPDYNEDREYTTQTESIFEPKEKTLKNVFDAYKKGHITKSKFARIMGGIYGHQGDYYDENDVGVRRMREDWKPSGIPVNINLGIISHLDKLKANRNFAQYLGGNKNIPTKIRKQAQKFAPTYHVPTPEQHGRERGRDRPNVGINRPGGGRGQSPTGGDVAGTPFARGGILGAF